MAHGFAHRPALAVKGGFLHQVTGQSDAEVFATLAEIIRKRFRKTLGTVRVVEKPRLAKGGGVYVKEELRQRVKNVNAESFFVSFRKIVRPRDDGSIREKPILKGPHDLHLRLVGEDGGDCLAEFLTHNLLIGAVGIIRKRGQRVFVQRVHVAGLVKGIGGLVHDGISVVTDAEAALAILESFVPFATAKQQAHGIGGKKLSAARLSAVGGKSCVLLPLYAGKNQRSPSKPAVLGNCAARKAGRITILVVKPSEHTALFGVRHASFDALVEFLPEVRGGKPCARVHMIAAEAHFAEKLRLTHALLFFELIVPRPKGRAAILGRRVLKKFITQFFGFVFVVQHNFLRFISGHRPHIHRGRIHRLRPIDALRLRGGAFPREAP